MWSGDSTSSFRIARPWGWAAGLGCYKLHRPKEQASNWVWIIDHSNQIGKEKCLVILGVEFRNCPRRARNTLSAWHKWNRSNWSR